MTSLTLYRRKDYANFFCVHRNTARKMYNKDLAELKRLHRGNLNVVAGHITNFGFSKLYGGIIPMHNIAQPTKKAL